MAPLSCTTTNADGCPHLGVEHYALALFFARAEVPAPPEPVGTTNGVNVDQGGAPAPACRSWSNLRHAASDVFAD